MSRVQKRSNSMIKTLLSHLSKSAVVSPKVLTSDGNCSSCNKNFYHMDYMTPALLKEFIGTIANKEPSRFSGLLTLSKTKINLHVEKELMAVDRFMSTIPNRHNIEFIVDQANLLKGTNSLAAASWIRNNRDRLIEVTQFEGPYQMLIRTYDSNINKTFRIKMQCYFHCYDDLLCIYMALLMPNLPLIVSLDRFRDHKKEAYQFEEECGHPGFGFDFEMLIDNLRAREQLPKRARSKFYLVSHCATKHHVLENGVTYCVDSGTDS